MATTKIYCDTVDVSLFCGRWVQSATKHQNLDSYTQYFSMNQERARREATEPIVHVITSATRERVTLVHQLPLRDSAQVTYTLEVDGNPHPIPPLLREAGETMWMHKFDERGLMSEKHLHVNGKPHILRTWRSLPSENEIRMDIHVYEVNDGGKESEAAHAVRFFLRCPFKEKWIAAAAQFFSGMDVAENLQVCVKWMRAAKAKGAALVVLPENSNRDRQYFVDGKPSKQKSYEMSEDLDGDFVKGLQAACRELQIWLVVGVDLKGPSPGVAYIGQLLIRPDGEIEGVHKKHVLWDYEYTLFEPGNDPYQVYDTELGRLGLLVCADGIVPEAARVLSLKGAQVLLNSLNSRGPDEMRVHIPLRAIENGVWHVASNSVGNPNSVGLLWPWTGGSEVCSPSGERVVASEEEDDMVVGEVVPLKAESKISTWVNDIFAHRRPDLYGVLTTPLTDVACSIMYGPAPEVLPFPGPASVKVAMMQLSRVHTMECTEWMTKRQVSYAARRGAALGVLPELWCFKRGEVAKDPAAAARYSQKALELLVTASREHNIYLCTSLVEADGTDKLFHTAYLISPDAGVLHSYRKAHLNSSERAWASAGDALAPVVSTPLGRIALMVGDEVWIPEVSRCLALNGVEIVLHPTDWDCAEAGEMAATERAGENRFHLVSVTRLDCPGKLGSQTTLAGEYIGGEPIPLMRYAQGVWARHNVEEQILVELLRRQAHCKMMGDHLDVLHKRFPELYSVCTMPNHELPTWRNATGGVSDSCPGFTEESPKRPKLDL